MGWDCDYMTREGGGLMEWIKGGASETQRESPVTER